MLKDMTPELRKKSIALVKDMGHPKLSEVPEEDLPGLIEKIQAL